MVTINALGGYNEIGRNSTAATIGDNTFLFDLGLHLENYVKLTENQEASSLKWDGLVQNNAVADMGVLGKRQQNIRMVLPTHAHLDHIGAVPFLGKELKCPVLSTPYAVEVLKANMKDNSRTYSGSIIGQPSNSSYAFSPGVKVELIHTTHSTPHTAMMALHTKEGVILYANDFKFDHTPTLGRKPNFNRLQELGKQGIKCLIADSTYAPLPQKTPSEAVAKQMLHDTILNTDTKDKGLLLTTFSSHIARLKTIVELGTKLNRKVVFLGRSLSKYVRAAEQVGITNMAESIEFCRFTKQIKKKLTTIQQNKHKYLMVATGHQGEPDAVLSKMIDGTTPYGFDHDDHVIFSCKTIPTPANIENRARLEKSLCEHHVRLFTDVHVSGHGAREDLRDLVTLTKPEHIIPSHGNETMRKAFAQLAYEMGYDEKNVHLVKDKGEVELA